jgi:hypothetical protein
MGGQPFPEISCILCSKPVNLKVDLSADENGKAVHTECYVQRIINPQGSPSAAEQSCLKDNGGDYGCLRSMLAIHTRPRCGLVRGCPVLSSHFCLGAAPQVGHRTPSICFGLSSFVTQTSTYKRSSIGPDPGSPSGRSTPS